MTLEQAIEYALATKEKVIGHGHNVCPKVHPMRGPRGALLAVGRQPRVLAPAGLPATPVDQIYALRQGSGLQAARPMSTTDGRLIHTLDVPKHQAILCEVVP
jgi:hypothetical protein